MDSLLSIDDLRKLFDKCIEELRQEPPENETLYNFSGLFDILSDTTGKPVWSAIRPFMALLANEISEINILMPSMYGVIDEEVRRRVLREFKELLNQTASIIDKIKKELCEGNEYGNEYNGSKIIELLGKLDKIYLKIIHERVKLAQTLRAIKPIPPPPEG